MVIQRRAATERAAVVQDTITGILLLVVATLIQFETFTVVMFTALEGVALAWIGRRWNLNYVWYAGSAVLLWGALVLLATPGALRAEDVAQVTVVFHSGWQRISLSSWVLRRCFGWHEHFRRREVRPFVALFVWGG